MNLLRVAADIHRIGRGESLQVVLSRLYPAEAFPYDVEPFRPGVDYCLIDFDGFLHHEEMYHLNFDDRRFDKDSFLYNFYD